VGGGRDAAAEEGGGVIEGDLVMTEVSVSAMESESSVIGEDRETG